MTTGLRAAALWMFAVGVSALLRYGLVRGLSVWTPDGRLAVAPGAFTLINTAQIALAGALFFALAYPASRPGPR